MKQILIFQNKLLCDTFMPNLKQSRIRTEIQASILEAYINRVRLKFNQEKYADLQGISWATLKRIELGQCYDLVLINKYCN